MKRPKLRNGCPARLEPEGYPPSSQLKHEILMVVSDPVNTPLGVSFMEFAQVYPDDEGGEFWIITSICGHCGAAFTITKDVE